ncbi:membrane lipoprotein lipid attachment site-containing protein [Algoriella sp.]|uniref:membrane lipoprotein lipid attachment site-containing protein n=1 Tax=Algoriella sp. TaxID=1872434 RepID=UPI002FCAB8B4
MKKITLVAFAVLALSSCDKKVVQYPISYSNDDFMKRSQERGKLLHQEELQWFDEYIKTSNQKFVKTSSGFGFRIQEKKHHKQLTKEII